MRCFCTQCEEDQTHLCIPKEYFDLWGIGYYGHCGSLCKQESESPEQMQSAGVGAWQQSSGGSWPGGIWLWLPNPGAHLVHVS